MRIIVYNGIAYLYSDLKFLYALRLDQARNYCLDPDRFIEWTD